MAKAGFNDKTPLERFSTEMAPSGRWDPEAPAVRTPPGATRTAPPCAPLERFRHRDFGHWTTKTFDDPQTYTKPFTVKIPHELLADSDVFENYCENEKDLQHRGREMILDMG